MKRIISILIVSVLLMTLTFPVQAAENPTFTAGTVTGRVGDTVEVVVNVSNNPGITALQLTVGYSNSNLELLAVNDCGLFSDSVTHSPLTQNPVYISWFASNSGNNDHQGDLVKLRFKIKKGAKSSNVTLSYDTENVFNSSFKNVAFSKVNGKVNVSTKKYMLGDVDRDSEIAIIDATVLQRYVAEIPIYFGMNNTIADADGDGILSIIDATAIQRWLAEMKTLGNIGAYV